MKSSTPVLLFLLAIVLAVAGFFLIGFSCPYSFVSTVMTGRIKLPGIWLWLPYKWILSLAVYLVLQAFYGWARSGSVTRKPDPLLFTVVGVGIAAIGFLSVDYPCPFSIGLWDVLDMEASIGGVYIAYQWILLAAACPLLYAAYAHATAKPATQAGGAG